jgi:hypothetical protein
MAIELVQVHDKRTENLPTSTEISSIVPTSSNRDYRDIRVYLRGDNQNSYTQIHQNHALYVPLHYGSLCPNGDEGWCHEMGSKYVVEREIKPSVSYCNISSEHLYLYFKSLPDVYLYLSLTWSRIM